MPYVTPPSTTSSSSSLSTATHSHSHHGGTRPGHRRSYTGPGAFASLGSLPRRTPPTTPAATATPGAKKSVFHLDDDDEDSTSEEDASSPHREHGGILSPYPPALKLNPRSTLSLNLNMLRPTVNLPPHSQERKGPPIAANDAGKPQEGGIPFPTSSPSIASPTITTASPAPFSPSPYASPSPSVPGVRPTVVRTSSSPVILLSNGKPLKSSLKSSNSSPIISHNHHLHPHHNPHFPHHQQHHSHHLRAASAPCTPQSEPTSSESSTPLSTSSSTESLPSTPKNVHFAPKLSSVRVFNRSAKPASLLGEETETETEGTEGTEGESLFPSNPVFGYTKSGIQRRFSTAAAYPFPKFLPSSSGGQDAADGGSSTKAAPARYKLAGTPSTSQIPASFPSPYANIHLEGIDLVHVLPTDASAAAQAPHLTMTGTLLVRNLSYAKTVAVRFTLDEWQTTSEVSGRYIESLDRLPSSFFLAHSNSHQPNRSSPFNPASQHPQPASGAASWDRFGFTIKLEDFQSNLHEKTMWMVARFGINDGKDEFWDNNSGRNYRIGFDIAAAPAAVAKRERARGTSAPAAPIPAMPLPALPVKPAQPQLTIPPYVSPSQHNRPKRPSVDPQYATFHIAAVKATNERLSKLNLRNYAAPVKAAVPPAPSTTPTTPLTPPTDTDTTPTSTPSVGIVTTVTPPSPPPPSTKIDTAKDETDSSDDDEEMVTPDTSPLVATPKWDKVPSPTEDAAASVKEKAPTTGAGISLYFPWGNSTSTPASNVESKPSSSPAGSPKLELPSPSLDSSDTAYKAFLKQWCFARDSSPSVATGPAVPNPGGIQVS